MIRSMPNVSNAAINGGSEKMPLVVIHTWSRIVWLTERLQMLDIQHQQKTSSARASIIGSISPI